MNTKKYVLKLTTDERTWLEGIVRTGKSAAWKIEHAHALLKMDQGEDGPGWDDERIAEAFGMTTRSLESWRKRAVEESPQAVLERQYAKRPQARKLDGAGEAQLVKLACSRARGKCGLDVEFIGRQAGGIADCGVDFARNGAAHAQKNDLKPWLKQQWCIAPERDAEFACQMEQVLEVYCRAYDARHPVICMDEQPKQLIDEARAPVAARPGVAAKEDFEYVRRGVCVVWMFVEPLAGWRTAPVSERKTAVDWAQQVKAVVDAPRYAKAERITLVCDNLNTHRLASLYEAFPAEEALRLAKKLELVHSPKHGSWLNMAEPELLSLT